MLQPAESQHICDIVRVPTFIFDVLNVVCGVLNKEILFVLRLGRRREHNRNRRWFQTSPRFQLSFSAWHPSSSHCLLPRCLFLQKSSALSLVQLVRTSFLSIQEVNLLITLLDLQKAYADYDAGKISAAEFKKAQDKAAEDSVKRFEAAGQPVVTDGEQRASS